MNNNRSFSTTTTISEDYHPYNDHYSSHPQLPFSPCSSINDIFIQSNSNTSANHLDHHHHNQFLQAPSPFSQFEFVQDFALVASFLPQNDGHNENQTNTTNDHHFHHHPSLLPLNNPIGESLVEPLVTITPHIEDSHRISTSQDLKMNKVKKPSRTDRHSKIKTAKGTRDRRMRLSLDVAKELFGLQDMLGFDKASQTVEWLLIQAKPEIIKITSSLSNHSNHGSFSSCGKSQTRPKNSSSDLCKLASMCTAEDRGSNTNSTETRENKVDGRSMRGKRKMLQPRTPILKKLSKEARVKARERAKDRTKEKMMNRISEANVFDEEAYNHYDEIVKNNKTNVYWNSFEVTPCQEEIEELLCKNYGFAVCNEFVVNKLNSSFQMPNHHCSQGAASSTEQQHQFTDLHHFLGKPRDLMYR